MKFGKNSAVFFGILLLTICAWIGFEVYHQKTDQDIPAKLITLTNTPLDSSLDVDTLNKIYEGKDNFYTVNGN